jgi:hypothetical protein
MRRLAGTILCLALCSITRSAELTRFHEKISVSYEAVELSAVLKDIQKQAGVRLNIQAPKQLQHAATVSATAGGEAAGRVLTRLLMPRRMKLKLTGPDTADVVPRSDREEYDVQREATFAFEQKPTVKREGDRYVIRFETTAFCDASIAVEGADGRIVRHLASGVLGMNAPKEFLWNSKQQVVVWDGKDDGGKYVEDPERCTIRVSLGLKPRYERALYWAAEKRVMSLAPRVVACEEGVLLSEGRGVDKVLLFDHDGEYVRTVYPFPRDKLKDVDGLKWRTAFRSGKKLPQKLGANRSTMLTSGNSDDAKQPHIGGMAVTAMAVRGTRIVLARDRINRLALDGSTGGRPLSGPRTTHVRKHRRGTTTLHPTSAAISPDEKWLYLSGYGHRFARNWNCPGLVQRVTLDGEGQPELFPPAAVRKTKDGQFVAAMSVDCDEKGNVYVADYLGDCVKVFSSDGAFLKRIDTKRPSIVRVHRRTQDILVLSCGQWLNQVRADMLAKRYVVTPMAHRFGPLANPMLKKSIPLPLPRQKYFGCFLSVPGFLRIAADFDSWADELTVWVAYERNVMALQGAAHGDGGRLESFQTSVLVFREKDGKMQVLRDFGKTTTKKLGRPWPPDYSYQRLYVLPTTGELFVKEDQGPGKSHYELIRIDPKTGRVRRYQMPFDAEDVCFDRDGRLYMRTDALVVRYDAATLREVPWDYGEEHYNVGFSSIGGGRRRVKRVVSALRVPCVRPVCWHMGGMVVSNTGRLAVAVNNHQTRQKRMTYRAVAGGAGGKYVPILFPGRRAAKSIHVFDRHGNVVYKDAWPGILRCDGIGMDNRDNLYVMSAGTRRIDGKQVFESATYTIMKARAGKGKILSTNRPPIPLPKKMHPKRPPELGGSAGQGWTEGVEWFYGGVGYANIGCSCWHARFCLDDYARSFAPEVLHYSIAVLDTNGNLICRVGRYGNTDDGMPLVKRGGPPSPRSIGGDEVALMHPMFVASHTDRRLFIADAGNFCIRSVKLDYHASESVGLRRANGNEGPPAGLR